MFSYKVTSGDLDTNGIALSKLDLHGGTVTDVAGNRWQRSMDFLRLPLIGLLGYFYYGEAIDGWLILGAALILGGNAISLLRENARQRA